MTDLTAVGLTIAGACPWCSGPPEYGTQVIHTGICPRLRAIEYHPNGTVKRVEFRVVGALSPAAPDRREDNK